VVAIDVEAADSMEAVAVATALQVTVTMTMTVGVGVDVGVDVGVGAAMRRLSTEPQLPEEYAIFIGPREPVTTASTARSSTSQGSRRLRPPHRPGIPPPTFFPSRAWP
jgi:hypothetical protein